MAKRLIENNHLEEYKRIILDELSDGQWHPVTKINKCVGSSIKLSKTENVQAFLNELVEGNYLLTGYENYRMPEKFLKQWRNSRNLSLDRTNSRSPRYFGNILEDDGWAKAPLERYSLLNFRVESNIELSEIESILKDTDSISRDETGLVRILTKNGEETYYNLKDWADDNSGAQLSALRMNHNTYRRDIKKLPQDYLDDLCAFYGKFAFILLRSNMSSIEKYLDNKDDIQQQIYIWILNAISRYDDTKCIPFAGFLSSVLKKWVHDLSRKSFGRASSDTELKHAKAIERFENEFSRTPNTRELADYLDETVAKIQKESLSIRTVNYLRSTKTLDSDDFDIPLVAKETPEKQIESYLDNTILSSALLSTAIEQSSINDGRSFLALLSIYDKTWLRDKSLAEVYKTVKTSQLSDAEAKILKGSEKKIRKAYSS